MTRKQARDLAFKLLYQTDIQREPGQLMYALARDEIKIDEQSDQYIRNILSGVEAHSHEIDEIITKTSSGWQLNRISKIVLAVLRLSIFELRYCADIPASVAINEAVGLTKTYEGEESAKFVNGILSVVQKEEPACR